MPAKVRWLLVSAMASTLLSITLLMRIIQLSPEHQRMHRAGGRVLLVSAVLILLLGFSKKRRGAVRILFALTAPYWFIPCQVATSFLRF